MTQTRHGIPPEFLDTADRFVQLANQMNDQYPREWVAATLMYAAARYSAFVCLTDESAGRSLAQARAYYTSEFDKMLGDNLDELSPVYRPDAPGGSA